MSTSKTVMIVDDDPDVLEQLRHALKQGGYQVVAAGSEEEAEDLFLSVKPDLAILDLMMDHMDSGFVLARRLKKLYEGTPVILLTAVTSQTGISFEAPSDDTRSWLTVDKVLDKPVRSEQVRTEVRRLLGEPPESQAAAPHGH
ncbi:MAG: response regulator [Planctomycetota bacterium]